ncbi:hypothetical protein FRB96_007477 [Tulasnella sp. 330]|nr:hypothetical protein FRB96_007477 [Tulasnella sp. 330]KAG8868258.1 hypothetical protein FRB97_002584 [Tulasnella sp. 331]KAG8869467.1 hypothetical protein FRB98_002532 [Tulasnella sp. 332]
MDGLLPSAGRPHELLLTHALELRVHLTNPDTNFWEIKDARLNPLPEVKSMMDGQNPGEFDRRRKETLASPNVKDDGQSKNGNTIAGVMWLVLTCSKPGMLCTYPMSVSQNDVDERRKKMRSERWIDEVKVSILPRAKFEQAENPNEAGDTGSAAPMKKRRTRRSKAKTPGRADDGQDSATSAASSVSPPVPPSTILSLNWADLVEEEGGALPDLSGW